MKTRKRNSLKNANVTRDETREGNTSLLLTEMKMSVPGGIA